MFPFEIHITVRARPEHLLVFTEACRSLKIKSIILELSAPDGDIADWMTSSVVLCRTLSEARSHALRLRRRLEIAGLRVIRTKIEVPPWHPDVPTRENGKAFNEGQYIESHSALLLELDAVEDTRRFVQGCGGHLSRNPRKVSPDGVIVMCTLRHKIPLEDFHDKLRALLGQLRAVDPQVGGKTIVEFAIWDSHEHHDHKWLNG